MSMPTRAYIALGSNVGDRHATIVSAARALQDTDGIDITAMSSIIETPPVGETRQGCYLNAVIELDTTLPPRPLLSRCLQIEADHGRDRTRERRWGPRPLDLDVLLWGDTVIDEPGLSIPHPRMYERLFVLGPLAEIAPALIHPVLGRSIQSLRESLTVTATAGAAAQPC
jgi:2-amino-4-hydroxy-6-hydroxymethyldihydropteridine diphosphokinase